MHFGDAPGHFSGDQHLMIGDHGTDGLDCGRQHLTAHRGDFHRNRICLAASQRGLPSCLFAMAVIEVKSANAAEQGKGC
ncbi:hypothetical protein D9M71_762160 [compost metagenome]